MAEHQQALATGLVAPDVGTPLTKEEELEKQEKDEKEKVRREALKASLKKKGLNSKGYPLRPDQQACLNYLKSGGECLFKDCKFDHPEDVELNSRGYPLRPGCPPCPYYLRMLFCKFHKTCKFDHPEDTSNISPQPPPGVDLNSAGFPLRPDLEKCDYYLKTGRCKFGAFCRWDHPESSRAAVQAVQMDRMQAAAQGGQAAPQVPLAMGQAWPAQPIGPLPLPEAHLRAM